jgi:hypothetical protein
MPGIGLPGETAVSSGMALRAKRRHGFGVGVGRSRGGRGRDQQAEQGSKGQAFMRRVLA